MEDSCHLAKESHFAGEHHYQREVMMLLLVLVFGSLINRRVAQEGFIHLFSSFIITPSGRSNRNQQDDVIRNRNGIS